ncbi:SERPINE1 mRNA-binding protein 1 isoform X5 [Carettochelys insculpta]|uniref:SERPINE1 mRNA-binding protein 1 isoform X5 n=1 Tax=Carettochelys insculpta TaxID=44489 RepID=UPI003EB70D01
MPGHLQEGFGCVVTNRFDQLFDDESDPFEVLRAAESRRKESGGGGSQGGGGGARSGQATQANSSGGVGSGGSGQAGGGGGSSSAAKQLRRESQKERKNPLPPFAASAGGAGDRREEGSGQPAAPLRKEGIRRIGRRPDQQQQQQPQGEGKPIDRRQERRPPRERRFDKPAEEKGEGGEFSVDKPIIDRLTRGRGGPGGRGGRGGRGRGLGRGDGFDSRGKREFDRHSGSDRSSLSHSHFSGLKHEDKRGGSGSHNWGTVKDELTELDQSNVTEETPEGEEHPPADSENKENEVEEVKEEGPKEMTLDEWKAIQNKDRAKVEFNIRKPNEGADGQWKKGFVLHKSKSEETT